MCGAVSEGPALGISSSWEGVSVMSNESETPRPRHYIIVVHGVGEQRHN